MTHSTPTASDLAALRWACLVDPFDMTARGVLADALEETGKEMETQLATEIRSGFVGLIQITYAEVIRNHAFASKLIAALDVINRNMDLFCLHPISQVMVVGKIPYAIFMPYQPTEYEWHLATNARQEQTMTHRLPPEVFNRLTMGNFELESDRRVYTDHREPAEDLSRAIVSLGREHAGLPPLRWPK